MQTGLRRLYIYAEVLILFYHKKIRSEKIYFEIILRGRCFGDSPSTSTRRRWLRKLWLRIYFDRMDLGHQIFFRKLVSRLNFNLLGNVDLVLIFNEVDHSIFATRVE